MQTKYKELTLRIPKEENIYYKNNPKHFDELISLIEDNRCHFTMMLNKIKTKKNPNVVPKYQYLKDWIQTCISQKLNDDKYSIFTKCFWIIHGITQFPICHVCNKSSNYIGKNVNSIEFEKGYSKYCCRECGNKGGLAKTQQTNLLKYGNVCSMHGKMQKDKIKQHFVKKYGVDNPAKADKIKLKIKNTIKNFDNEFKQKLQDHKKQTCLIHFGVDHQFKSDVIKQKCAKSLMKKYGVDNYFKSNAHKLHMADPFVNKLRMDKQFETKCKNGTLNVSSQEDEGYKILCQKFGIDDVLTQYKSERYPFHCDYYVRSLDLYIELNEHWSHGGHFFDENSIEDVKKAELWKSKGNKYYNNSLNVWTSLDVKKAKVAIENQLHYIVFWKIEELKDWANGLKMQENVNLL